MKKYTLSFLVLVLLFSLTAIAQHTQPTHKVLVKEVLQTSNYTYLLVEEDAMEEWLATPKMEVAVGDTCYYMGGMTMTNWDSKELDRQFNRVIFLERVGTTPEGAQRGPQIPAHGVKPKPELKRVDVEPLPDGITIEELYANKEKYSGKVVKIRGQVVKFNTKILGKNWAHIQDGSASGHDFDLTVTTEKEVNIGDVVIFEGTVTLDKDFGSGYFFKIILEDAKVVE